MSEATWQQFTFHLSLHLPERDYEADFLVVAREEGHLRLIGTLLAFLYRARLAE